MNLEEKVRTRPTDAALALLAVEITSIDKLAGGNEAFIDELQTQYKELKEEVEDLMVQIDELAKVVQGHVEGTEM